ncbi:MAG TPA: methionine--tRNA ligase [Tenericutes bacterium]|nr:methionine--tRNA ligase [Mycoplasmatota bacterium]
MNKPFYISTAIAYASAKPHIGNTYEIILADAIARYKRLQGYDVYFQTGTDEHGQKIEDKAKLNNENPQEYVDDVALEIRRIWDLMNTTYDRFVRTTNPSHKEKVGQIFKKLYEQGDIYKGKYEGLYCIPCESFCTESQLDAKKCPDCGRDVIKSTEEAYFLRLSKYSDKLEKYIYENPSFIEPESRKNEIINNFIKPGIKDLCVSRTSFKWGIPVSFDEKHVVYVWIDALSNYITFLGYDIDKNHSEEFNKFWPADIHLIGKDILRFHAIYWPIMLMALDLPLPKKIFAHPWLLAGGEKMSKSKGNLMYADELVKHYGVDAVRYFVLHETPFDNDGIITHELLIERINSDLANNLGNLVNRTISMSHKYFDGVVVEPNLVEEIDDELISLVKSTPKMVEEKMANYRVADSIDCIFNIFRRANKYIDETCPWILGKEENYERLSTVLYNLLESIRVGAVLLQPFLPDTANSIFEQLNTRNTHFDSLSDFNGLDYEIKLNNPKPLFIRIDKNKKLEEIEK